MTLNVLQWLAWVICPLAIAVAALLYLTQDRFDWPTTFSAASDVAQIVALIVGAAWAYKRFGLTRESRTFLRLATTATVVSGGPDAVLVAVVVRLENIGGTRITARTGARLSSGFFFDDEWDQCQHAGTLKVRAIPQGQASTVFDWYSLQPHPATLVVPTPIDRPGNIQPRAGDLEQIDYLADFLDELVGFTDVDFWLEPNEIYELTVPLWLPPGDYGIKSFYLGQDRTPHDEEYWSHLSVFHFAPPKSHEKT